MVMIDGTNGSVKNKNPLECKEIQLKKHIFVPLESLQPEHIRFHEKKKSTVQGQANPSIHALVIQVVLRVNIQTRYIKLICEFIFVFLTVDYCF